MFEIPFVRCRNRYLVQIQLYCSRGLAMSVVESKSLAVHFQNYPLMWPLAHRAVVQEDLAALIQVLEGGAFWAIEEVLEAVVVAQEVQEVAMEVMVATVVPETQLGVREAQIEEEVVAVAMVEIRLAMVEARIGVEVAVGGAL